MTEENKLFNEHIGKKVKELRERAKLNQSEAAKILDVSRVHFVNIEKGRNNLTLYQIITLAEIFGASVTDFTINAPAPDIDKKLSEIIKRNKTFLDKDLDKFEKQVEDFLNKIRRKNKTRKG